MSPDMQKMMDVARNYCHLIENCCEDDLEWLQQVAEQLAQLHAAIVHLKESEEKQWDEGSIDLDKRFDMYAQLKGLLGEDDAYWLEFDVNSDYQHMSGSLADDLTDIYCELKQGLEMLTRSPDAPAQVLSSWGHGYRMHWGQHLLDAERHLYALDVRGRLEPII